MDPKLLFWCVALLDLGVVAGCAVAGVRAIRRGDVRVHRRCMLAASVLVAVFLAAYLLKVALLGKEDRSLWTRLDHTVLYVHESFVAAMLLGGAFALWRASRFRVHLGRSLTLPSRPLPGRLQHRSAGWIAVVGAALAFATAGGVLAGMFVRASG
jgi:uncharacterized membrane protein YozB (DUF420 family)